MKKISLNEITGGVLQEQFAKAFNDVVENLADPNTSYKDARKITISLTFRQNERRDDMTCDVLVTAKLSPQVPTRTAFAIGKNLKNGEYFAEEYGRNQMTINDLSIDEDTGELSETRHASAQVLDLRKCN